MTVVLVVDDDAAIRRTLGITLRARGYEVEPVADGRSALQSLAEQEPDVVVLDLGLPDLDGIEVLRRIRATSSVPVVVLSARQESDDKVEALDLGADDYVTKPFGMEELLARLRAAMRRAGAPVETVRAGDLVIDVDDRTVTRAGEAVHLTPTEWRLLEVLVRADGRLVRQATLLHDVWGPEYERETHYLRVYLAQLRRKLEADASRPEHLLTDPGLGYRFVP
ncbi:two-component system response regulator [Aeromicrobium sp. Root495]|uniref:response regulator n=1 Tax=Aeromicrobium sp. Root495 TaxID=1736550 RepID=UPI0006FD3A28|nr:response regulator [Aeromicrobium sp. Root495]KQY58665.1 two-component system response regulator [Aeromicrobium sp. Root495]